jgi:RTX calcium-binding nonapeptide repeat (4 copies)/Domain of unknown function DUF11/WD40-like Beta Propeller Repeat
MRWALIALVGALAAAVPAAGSTPSARILFDQPAASQFDLVETDADATGYLNLTPGDQPFYVGDQDGSWSPDGSRIVFQSHRDSNVSTEIYVMNADGSDQRRLTHDGPDGVQSVGGSVFDTSPLWSPRGDVIASLKGVSNKQDVWLMAPDGSGRRALTTDGLPRALLQWFADGTRLLVQQGDSFYAVPISGAAPTKLGTGIAPVLSPDGSRVAYAVPGAGLWVVGTGGGAPRELSVLPAANPSWSPDGTRIAFVGTRIFSELTSRFGPAQRSDIYTVRADGTDLQRLTGPFDEQYSTLPSGGSPTWWPDSSRLFFSSFRALSEPATTYQMNPDGSCEGRFGSSGPALQRPLWWPGSQPRLGPIQCVDLRLTLQPTAHPAALGEQVPIRFLVDNDGSEPATAVRVELRSPGPVRLGGPPSCSGPILDVTCTIDFLPPRGSQVVTFTASSTTAGNYPLTVTAGALEQDSDPTTNTTQTGVQVLPCTEVGTFGDDVLYGSPGPDKICGLTGADRIYGGAGNDYIDSGNGADIVAGGPGHDTILTKGGNDTVYARDGERDWVDCGSERDVAVVDRFDRTFHCETVVRPKKP